METTGTLPTIVPLGKRSVDWRNIQIEEWIANR
ncbi:MAG: AlpA family phage regulatory protein [Colwellia sp.]|nr:AlpA family phage regulatory protein [Colwellia sp.]